jgi:hypothetical protein
MLLKPYRAGQRAHIGLGNMHHRIKVTSESLRQRRSFTPILKMHGTAVTVSSFRLADIYASYRTKHFGDRATIKKPERGARCSSVALAEGPVECAMGTLLNSTSDRQIGFPQRNPRRGVD